jgi:MoxR-like ATPase
MDFQNPNATAELKSQILSSNEKIGSLVNNVGHVIKGKKKAIEEIVMVMIGNGHLLLHDVPGVGKTMLAKAFAKSIDAEFNRIQFTPDLLPSDVTGVSIFNPANREFEFKKGPVFTNILLADEINRASPKTQSALLEAMEERQVSVDNTQHKLGKFFFVMATKNPIEHAGTYPLPTAQLDRFMMVITMGYPDRETEMQILQSHTQNINPLDEISPVVHMTDVLEWQSISNNVYCAPVIDSYIVDLARETRDVNMGGYGVSTRAEITLKKAVRACALINGRDFVIPDDIHRVIKQIFAHRIGGDGKVGEAVVETVLQKISI